MIRPFSPPTYSCPFAYFLKTNMLGLVCFVHFMDIITPGIVFWKKKSNQLMLGQISTNVEILTHIHTSHLGLDIWSLGLNIWRVT